MELRFSSATWFPGWGARLAFMFPGVERLAVTAFDVTWSWHHEFPMDVPEDVVTTVCERPVLLVASAAPDLAQLCHLQRLQLKDWCLEDRDLEAIAAVLPGLRHLGLSIGCEDIGASRMETLRRRMRTINRGAASITDEGLRALASMTGLQSLQLSDFNGEFTAATPSGYCGLSELTALTALSFSNCSGLNDAAVSDIAGSAPGIQYFRISDCDRVTAEALVALRPLRRLRRLAIDGVFEDEGGFGLVFSSPIDLPDLPALETLEPDAEDLLAMMISARGSDMAGLRSVERLVLGCNSGAAGLMWHGCHEPHVWSAALSGLAQGCFPNLTSLDLSYNDYVDDSHLEHLTDLQLRSVCLDGTSASLGGMIRHLPGTLRELSLLNLDADGGYRSSYLLHGQSPMRSSLRVARLGNQVMCEGVSDTDRALLTDANLRDFLMSCPCLTSLEVHDLTVTSRGVILAIRSVPRLSWLTLCVSEQPIDGSSDEADHQQNHHDLMCDVIRRSHGNSPVVRRVTDLTPGAGVFRPAEGSGLEALEDLFWAGL